MIGTDSYMEPTVQSLTNELNIIRERYAKLLQLHGQLQIQNSQLEERVLSIVDTCTQQRHQLENELIDAKQHVFRLQETVHELELDKQQSKGDCKLAVRCLHRQPEQVLRTAISSIETSQESVSIFHS
jgi:uncharacterized protein (DUF342 family)